MMNNTEIVDEKQKKIIEEYGVHYFDTEADAILEAKRSDLYHFKTFIGNHSIDVDFWDCVFWLSDDLNTAHLNRGPVSIVSKHLATVIRGYMPENKTSGMFTQTYLPYVNWCSAKQLFPPERVGDPTLQILRLQPFSSEQAHHIHSTARIVYVLSWKGRCVVGMENYTAKEDLYPGKVIVLEKMCPHHFETDDESIVFVPLHVFSSTPLENNHPMFNGTYLVNQK